MRAPEPDARFSWALRNGAHVFALSAFAVAQPIFDILGQNPEFFAVRGSTAKEIVAFALVVTFALPLGLLVVEIVVDLASRRARQVVHLLFVGVLAAAIALHVIARNGSLTGRVALLACAVVGAAVALLTWRTAVVRRFLSILAVAPLAFLALFLLSSPVARLVFTEAAAAESVALKSRTPVVLIVFDEFSTAAIMDERERVDADRLPNFASLADDATWYRNATTVHAHTNHAVPAILDGKLPDRKNLPILADHPQNLFTLLGESYAIRAIESQTDMCPAKLCRASKAARFDPGASDRTGSLAYDVKTIYLHLLLPHPYVDDLPPISTTWGNFGGEEAQESKPASISGKPTTSIPACGRAICSFASLIRASRKPALHFVHSLLPHVPWLYLPSGKHYGGDVRVIPGSESGRWTGDRWLTIQARQRYLLQTGYTDRALGIVLRRLRATGIYDRALVVVTADHGETFRAGAPRRSVTRENLADIAFVPLFVKLPGQERGRIDDSPARTIDILPTIAEVLRASVPWRVGGRSLVRGKRSDRETVTLTDASGRPVEASLDELVAERRQDVAAFASLLRGGAPDSVYRIGPHRELHGKAVGSLTVRRDSVSRVDLTEREILEVVDLSTSLVPNYLNGVVRPSTEKPLSLAIAVNGRILATTWSYESLGKTRFSALVPEGALRHGSNAVGVYAIDDKRGRVVLRELGSSDVSYALRSDGSALRTGDGHVVRVIPGALTGQLRVQTPGDAVRVSGWAADVPGRRPAEDVVVLVAGRSVFVGHPGNIDREDIARRYGIDGAGFVFRLPRALFPPFRDDRTVRIFAITGSRASELRYPDRYRWKTR